MPARRLTPVTSATRPVSDSAMTTSHHRRSRVEGEFKWWAQHLVVEVVRDGCSGASAGDSCDARADLVAGATVGRAAGGPGPVLAVDCGRSVERGLGCCGGGVAGGRVE